TARADRCARGGRSDRGVRRVVLQPAQGGGPQRRRGEGGRDQGPAGGQGARGAQVLSLRQQCHEDPGTGARILVTLVMTSALAGRDGDGCAQNTCSLRW